MDKIKKILVLFLVLIAIYASIKFVNYYTIANEVILLENSSLKKYLRIHYLTENETLKNVEELKNYIKTKDRSLYNEIKNIDLQYYKKEGIFYHTGFDGVNDSIKKVYRLSDVDFFTSINTKGDIIIDLLYEFPKKTNTFYRVDKDSLIKLQNIKPLEFYKNFLNCESLKKKNLEYHSIQFIHATIRKGSIIYNNNHFSKESFDIIDTELKRSKFYLDMENTYFLILRMPDVSVYECSDNDKD